ncbi:MAG: hypothetical protein MUO34_13500, partial [Ignavibacteriaceae bacterium]|nr:hypothetical protein [Ignavibacteriaceae bacterium]
MKTLNRVSLIVSLALVLHCSFLYPQYENRWMSVGSLHNWYSEIGSEIEEAFVLRQQYGMQWPAIYRYQDMQCAKGLWLGCSNFTDENNNWYPYKVVTAGPRVPQFYALYPQSFKTISKFEPTYVTVNGYPSYDKEIIIDSLDSDLIWDRVIVNKVNTQLGVTIERKISQLSQGFNDNYIINEYMLTNTGNTDYDEDIELPNNTIDSLYLFLTYRYAINQSTRYVIGNYTGWGINTMNDARGDGLINSAGDPSDEQFRAQFSWHGYFPNKIVSYDNIGGPIWYLNSNALIYNTPDDTIGRLGAAQFVGTVTLYADKSTTEKVDDLGQPSTTSFIDSDMQLLQAGSDAFNIDRMTQEYNLMRTGHQTPRHADLVVPSGDYAIQTSQANVYPPYSGGTSYKIAYGPYTLLPGDSIRIVVAECAAGMSREEQIRVGELFKAGTITAYAKNTEVINQGRDSLFSTFQNAIEAFNENWNIPQPPRSPATFSVVSDSPKIVLDWTLRSGDPNPPVKIRIYRSQNFYFGDCEMIAELEDTVTHYEDTSVQIGKLYYYYITCVGQYQSGGTATPPGELESGRYYTQTYDPVKIGSLTNVNSEFINPYEYNLSQNYPNPFNPRTTIEYQIPELSFVKIKVYDVLGSEVSTL